ncbi:unnamed protein product [Arctogadus glacialis]
MHHHASATSLLTGCLATCLLLRSSVRLSQVMASPFGAAYNLAEEQCLRGRVWEKELLGELIPILQSGWSVGASCSWLGGTAADGQLDIRTRPFWCAAPATYAWTWGDHFLEITFPQCLPVVTMAT